MFVSCANSGVSPCRLYYWSQSMLSVLMSMFTQWLIAGQLLTVRRWVFMFEYSPRRMLALTTVGINSRLAPSQVMFLLFAFKKNYTLLLSYTMNLWGYSTSTKFWLIVWSFICILYHGWWRICAWNIFINRDISIAYIITKIVAPGQYDSRQAYKNSRMRNFTFHK